MTYGRLHRHDPGSARNFLSDSFEGMAYGVGHFRPAPDPSRRGGVLGGRGEHAPAPTTRLARATLLSIFTASLIASSAIGCAASRTLAEPPRTAREPVLPEAADVESSHRLPLAAWAEALTPITIIDGNSGVEASVRLYRNDGRVDPEVMERLAKMTAHGPETHALDPRTMQLAFKAAYYFKVKRLVVVSAYRPPGKDGKGGGRHATGQALDFKLPGVKAAKLAAYLRGYARAGVGIYTHPRTQFVHLDVRDESFHWLDASPPGKTWKEMPLRDPHRVQRDAAYRVEGDLPLDVAKGRG
jgi:uncharacterized protein YcbK (DUF882 family)